MEGRGENYGAIMFIWALCLIAIAGLVVGYIVINP
jgi:hypothetical protein